MKKMTALLLSFLVLLTLSACGQADKGETVGNVYQETYLGTVLDRFTEGGGSDWTDCLEIDVGDGKTVVFTILESTEITDGADISVGDQVKIECESYTDSGYHPALTLTVLDPQEEG